MNPAKLKMISLPLAGVAFGILVVHAGAQRLQDGSARKVFRRNQLQAVRLPLLLLLDDAEDLTDTEGRSLTSAQGPENLVS